MIKIIFMCIYMGFFVYGLVWGVGGCGCVWMCGSVWGCMWVWVYVGVGRFGGCRYVWECAGVCGCACAHSCTISCV